MSSALIRRLMACGFAPDMAQNICVVYIAGLSLSVLEEKISFLEKERRNVDILQPEPRRQKHG